MFGKKSPPTKPEHVNNTQDLAIFLKHLEKDFQDNPDRWENVTIAAYLEAIAAWIEDSGAARKKDKKVHASDVANLFFVGSIYE